METEAESSDSFLHDLNRRRIILPRVPEDLADQKIGEEIFWHNNEAKILEKKLGAANGLFIRHEMCMFIPAPSFHKLFLFKELKIGKKRTSTIADKTIRDIAEVALHQLRKIDGQFEKLSDGGASVEKVEVDFVVYIIGKTNEIDQISGGEDTFPNKWQANFDNFFEGKNFKNITCSCVCILESKVSEELVDERQGINTERKELKTLAEKMLGTEIFGWEPSDEKFRVSGDEELTFSDSEKVQQKFTELFGSNRMYFLPDIDHISDNLLSHIDDKGKVKDSDQHFSYTGELQLFYHEFVAHMKQQIPGIFIKDFQPHHIRNLFSWPYLRNYQIDWLFLGTDRIVVFEVGMVEGPEKIKDALNKKLKQVREHLMPFFQILLRTIDMNYNTDDKMNPESSRWKEFWEFVKTKVTFVILLPNAKSNAIKAYLNSRSESEKNLDPEVLVVCPEREHGDQNNFLAFNARGKAEPKQITIDELLTKTVHEITSSTSSNDGEPMKHEKRLSLITKLLTLSFLSVVDDPFRPLDVNERYAPDYQKVVRDCKSVLPSVKVNGHNLILTREQHRLLQADEKFLIIHGEAGSGKTALLLMKALQLASDSNIGKVLYVIPEDKEKLNMYPELFLRENEERLYEKFEIWRFNVKSFYSNRQLLDQLGSKIGENTCVALFIDELHYSAVPLLFYPAAYCWTSYVTHEMERGKLVRELARELVKEQEKPDFRLCVPGYSLVISKLCILYIDSLVKALSTEMDLGDILNSETIGLLVEKMRDCLYHRSITVVYDSLSDGDDAREFPGRRHLFWVKIRIERAIEDVAGCLSEQTEKKVNTKFNVECLSPIFGASHHIGKTAHDFIHKTKIVDGSTDESLIGNLHKLTIEQHLHHQIQIQPDKAVQGELIMIDFPETSVLGKRHLGIEIIDLENPILEEVLRKTNPHIKMLTDMVQISQPSHVSFLKPVTVTLPLHAKYKDWKKLETKLKDEFGRHIKIENGLAEISSFNFSPICLYYDEVKDAVAALVHRDQVDQMLHRRGVYLMVEQEIGPQNPAVLNVSFRPFFDLQEHERCRAARNVSFSRCLTIGPEGQLPQAHISFKMKWDTNFITSYNRSLEENLEFNLGHIDIPQTWSREKRREYLFAHPVNSGIVLSKNLRIEFAGDERNFSLKSSDELLDLEAEARVFIPSLIDLFEYLNSNSPKWLAFMHDYLKIDKMKFYDFILKDLQEEVEPKLESKRATMNEQDFRKLQETITTQSRSHVENKKIEKLKSYVLGVLGEVSDGRLTGDNLCKLAEALRYVDGDKLKHALRAGLAVFDGRTILRTTSGEFKSWIGGDLYMSS